MILINLKSSTFWMWSLAVNALKTKKAWSRRLIGSRATTPCHLISTKRPTPDWGVSVRLILRWLKSGSFEPRTRDESQKNQVAPNHSVRGYVNCNIDYSERMEVPSQARHDNLRDEAVRNSPTPCTELFSQRRKVPFVWRVFSSKAL